MVWNYKPKRLGYEDIRRIADEFLEDLPKGLLMFILDDYLLFYGYFL